jgi:hypothetical protein
MLLNEAFTLASLPTSNRTYDVVPAGWYVAQITDAEVKQTKSGTGEYIKIRYDIQGPTSQGRVVFGNLNVKNANPAAEKIGRQQLGDIMRSVGLSAVTDTDQLLGTTMQIKIDIRESEQYGPSNEVKAWKALAAGMAPPPAVKPPASNAKTAPPWLAKK